MRYPIGTRVRLVASGNHPGAIGSEGVVVEYNFKDMRGKRFDYGVDFPGDMSPAGSTVWGCPHEFLEPIINDGNQLSTWDECIKESGLNWRPGKVAA